MRAVAKGKIRTLSAALPLRHSVTVLAGDKRHP
jgi:hypothetical protein